MVAAYLALAWLLGVAAAAWSGGEQWSVAAAAAVFAVLSVCTHLAGRRTSGTSLQRFSLVLCLGLSALLFGGWRYAAAGGPDVSLAQYNGSEVMLRAVVSEEPAEGESGWVYRLDVREVRGSGGWQKQSGKILMTAGLSPRWKYGDLLLLRGELRDPPVFPDFNYRDYLLRQGVSSTLAYPDVLSAEPGHGAQLRETLIDVRGRLSESLSEVLPEPHASLAGGILIGSKSRIPDSLRDDMRATGTSHLVAVSGQNVSIVAAMLIAALAWAIGRRPAAWLSLAGIAAYAVLVGGSPSVVRGAAMGAVYVVAIASGRQNTAWVTLGLVAVLMTAADPLIVDDVSFQLSFAATLGLATMAGPLRERVDSFIVRWPGIADFPLTRPCCELASVTAAAILFTLPITALNFGEISLVAPVANLFVVPAFLAVGATAALAAVFGLIGLGTLGTWIGWPAAEYMVQAVAFFAGMPSVKVDPPLALAAAWYAALLAGVWQLFRNPARRIEPPRLRAVHHRRIVPVGGLAVLIMMAAVLAVLWVSRPAEGRLSVTVMDVGQGDAILVEGPRGNRVLIDGGPTAGAISQALGRNLPFDDQRIDLAVLSHAQSDHLGGLIEVVRHYDVRAVLDNPRGGDSALYRDWLGTLSESQVHVTMADRGQEIDLGGGAMLQVLAPDGDDVLLPDHDLNEASLVLRVTMGDVSFLLTGDLDENGERELLRSHADLSATVLKVGHHGSRTSTSEPFVAAVDPLIGVISVGDGNRFGHPAQAVLDRLEDEMVLRTDRDGDVRFETDGVRLWVHRQ
jgi:competence protein ComEC